jgi:hypothetical protein
MPMADEKKSSEMEAEDKTDATKKDQLNYESNPKHKEPWQPGKKGSLCAAAVRPLASNLLLTSVLWEDDKRYAVHDGRAYCAQEHLSNRWHGYPIGWRDVPPKLRMRFLKEGRMKKREIDRFWK